MIRKIREHLRDCGGDVYVWLTLMTAVLLVFCGAAFGIARTRLTAYRINAAVDGAFSNGMHAVRQYAGRQLGLGATDGTMVDCFGSAFAEALLEQLGDGYEAVQDPGGVSYTYRTAGGRELFTVGKLRTTYIDRLYGGDGRLNVTKGDVNGDGRITRADLDEVRARTGGYLYRADLDGDGKVDGYDVGIMEGLLSLAEAIENGFGDGRDNSAVIIASVEISVPVGFGSLNYGRSTDIYSFSSLYSFRVS